MTIEEGEEELGKHCCPLGSLVCVIHCISLVFFLMQVRWTKTAGSASDKFQETSVLNETLRIEKIQRLQGGRYYCKAENGVGVPAIKSIRVDVQCKSFSGNPDLPTVLLHVSALLRGWRGAALP